MGRQRTNVFRGEIRYRHAWEIHDSQRPAVAHKMSSQNKYDDGLRRVLRRAIPRAEYCYYTKRFLFDKVNPLTFKLAALFIFAMLLFFHQRGFER